MSARSRALICTIGLALILSWVLGPARPIDGLRSTLMPGGLAGALHRTFGWLPSRLGLYFALGLATAACFLTLSHRPPALRSAPGRFLSAVVEAAGLVGLLVLVAYAAARGGPLVAAAPLLALLAWSRGPLDASRQGSWMFPERALPLLGASAWALCLALPLLPSDAAILRLPPQWERLGLEPLSLFMGSVSRIAPSFVPDAWERAASGLLGGLPPQAAAILTCVAPALLLVVAHRRAPPSRGGLLIGALLGLGLVGAFGGRQHALAAALIGALFGGWPIPLRGRRLEQIVAALLLSCVLCGLRLDLGERWSCAALRADPLARLWLPTELSDGAIEDLRLVAGNLPEILLLRDGGETVERWGAWGRPIERWPSSTEAFRAVPSDEIRPPSRGRRSVDPASLWEEVAGPRWSVRASRAQGYLEIFDPEILWHRRRVQLGAPPERLALDPGSGRLYGINRCGFFAIRLISPSPWYRPRLQMPEADPLPAPPILPSGLATP